MKRMLFITLSISINIATLFASVKVGDLYYNLDYTHRTAQVTYKSFSNTKGYNNSWNIRYVKIPNYISYKGHEYRVKSIGKSAFMNCEKLISVIIPENVTKIEMFAFSKCTNLQSISIPNGVTTIESFLFNECHSLNSILIPTNVTRIGSYAFCDCTNLSSITIPESITSIGYRAFYGCISLSAITIPNSIKSIEGSTFFGCTKLKNVEIPESVTRIDVQAFAYCSSLESITIPSEVSYIGDNAFMACSHLQELNYPKKLYINKSVAPSATKLIAYGQNDNDYQLSPSIDFMPPLLELVEGTLSFSDENMNERIDGEETCKITFRIRNMGKGPADNCEVKVKSYGATNGITIKSIKLPTINVNKIHEIEIPISSNIHTIDGKVTFSIEVYEPNGWGIAPFDITVATKAYDPPCLQVVDYNVASNSGKIKKMEPFTLTFNLQNTKYGDAEDVKVKVNLPANIFVMDGSSELSFPMIKSGEAKQVSLTLAANNNYPTTIIPIAIDIKEKYGKFAENKQLDITLNQSTSSSINIAAKEGPQQERKEIQLAMLKSDVDRNIPQTSIKNLNTFVLIIANEHYQRVAPVPFALNDGAIFREYCMKTLGIQEKRIHYIPDATYNQIKEEVRWLKTITETFDDSKVIVYYAGHGIPDESSKTAYLLPVDGSGTDVSTGYKLDELYAALGNMPASRITVFMDACFSGSKREEGMLASARGVALKAKSGTPQGNMVVFSAAQGNETAYPNREKQHGLFTYYLLKKLQETEGNVSLLELGNYIITNVKQQSVLLNSKLQTPCVTPSSVVADSWQSWKLK